MIIHRFALNGKTECGAGPDKFGHLRISTTGAGVTCPACKPKNANECPWCGQQRSLTHKCMK